MRLKRIGVTLLALGCASPGAQQPGQAAETQTTGRWTILQSPVSYHFWNDSAETVMYPPQAPAPPAFRVVGDSIRIIDASRTSARPFALRRDTLFIALSSGPQLPFARLASGSESGVLGTWRHRSPTSVTILTFRSDSVMVMEVGVAPWPRRSGDTLSLNIERGTMRLVFHHANGRLVARNLDDGRYRSVTLVKRPWGCFGIGQLDGKARECR